jgi:glucokinase
LISDALVFDVGGTTLRAGIYRAGSGRVERVVHRDTPTFRTLPGACGDEIRERLCRVMDEMGRSICGGRVPGAVSVAFPGPIDPAGGVLAAPTLWGGERGADPVPLGESFRRLWPRSRVFVLNDMAAAGYCYRRHPLEDFCILTVSSGIGHKVFLNGEPVTGPHGRGGELGHLRVDPSPDAPVCDCGGRGHLGAIASGGAAIEQVKRLAAQDPEGFLASPLGRSSGFSLLDNQTIVAAFSSGDPWTDRVIRRMAGAIGQVLAAVHLALGVERFVIVGGFAIALGPRFRDMLCAEAAACAWDLGASWDSMIELGRSDEDAGLIGAGKHAAER